MFTVQYKAVLKISGSIKILILFFLHFLRIFLNFLTIVPMLTILAKTNHSVKIPMFEKHNYINYLNVLEHLYKGRVSWRNSYDDKHVSSNVNSTIISHKLCGELGIRFISVVVTGH